MELIRRPIWLFWIFWGLQASYIITYRQLVDAGWLQAVTRGYYEIPAARVIPLMACIIASGE
ncbi:hypothetical protein [Corynebacterium ulcerans]|uniref:hypothetical protein n=1 Tax=Corynebacterium ulcerans TaxID=65058 RepID=UPI0006B33FEB|nr:hypothetical protein [Corynebacterium ulcerans]SQG57062.1 Uncharacterised protein [Corynebacterium ulcerans]